MFIPAPEEIDLLKHFYQRAIGYTPGDAKPEGKAFIFTISRIEIEIGAFSTWQQLVEMPRFEVAVLFLYYWEVWDYHDRLVAIENGSRVRSCIFTDALLVSVSKDQQTSEVTLVVNTGSDCRFKLIGNEKPSTKNDPSSDEFDGLNDVHRCSPLLRNRR